MSARAIIVSLCALLLLPACKGESLVFGENYAVGARIPFDCAIAAFCDGFDAAFPGGNAGDLDENAWSVARLDTVNVGQGLHNLVWPTTIEGCDAAITDVLPPGDFHHCGSSGRLLMSYDGHGTHVLQSARIRQPFDFADRVGVIGLDVDAQARMPGGHGYFWSVVLSDEPAPGPFTEEALTSTLPRAGVVIEFGAALVCTPGGDAGGGDDLVGGVLTNAFNGVSAITIFDEHVATEVPIIGGNETCFRTAAGLLNHIEIQVSASRVEVFASDAGDPGAIRSVAVATGLSLSFTRGYVSLLQVSQEADKCTFTTPDCQDCDDPACPVMSSEHTYQWDNVGFDGPALATERSYAIPDAAVDHPLGGVSVGWLLFGAYQEESFGIEPRGMSADGTTRVDPIAIDGVDPSGAMRAWLTLDAWLGDPGETLDYRFNGGSWRTYRTGSSFVQSAVALAIPVALADLRAGTNTLEMSSSSGFSTVANLELVLDAP